MSECGQTIAHTKVSRARRVLAYLWVHVVMLVTCWLPDLGPCMKLRGFLLGPAMGRRGRRFAVCHDVHLAFSLEISVGDDVYLANGAWLLGNGGITIDNETMVGPYCVIVSCDHSKVDGCYSKGPLISAPIHIGRGCWLGAHCVVVKGTTIGSGCVVGAGSVAVGTLPDNAVAVGIPARVKRIEN